MISFIATIVTRIKPPRKLLRMKLIFSVETMEIKHVQYCQSDTGRESTSRPDKLLQTAIMLYGPYLFVSAVGGWVKRR